MERFDKVKGPMEGALRRKEGSLSSSWRAGQAPLDRAGLVHAGISGYLPWATGSGCELKTDKLMMYIYEKISVYVKRKLASTGNWHQKPRGLSG